MADERWLIAERCDADIYMGWHIYLRDHAEVGRRNNDGTWGWLRRGHYLLPKVHTFLAALGIPMRQGGDGSCDGDGYEALARRFPLGDARGGVRISLASDIMTLVYGRRYTVTKVVPMWIDRRQMRLV